MIYHEWKNRAQSLIWEFCPPFLKLMRQSDVPRLISSSFNPIACNSLDSWNLKKGGETIPLDSLSITIVYQKLFMSEISPKILQALVYFCSIFFQNNRPIATKFLQP